MLPAASPSRRGKDDELIVEAGSEEDAREPLGDAERERDAAPPRLGDRDRDRDTDRVGD